MDRLYDQVRSANVPAVFLQVERRLARPSDRPGHYVDAMLSMVEAVALAAKLRSLVPDRADELETLVASADQRLRTPFYFGLVAFGREFAGLEPYVRSRLDSCSAPIVAIARLASLVYHYGQELVPLQVFAGLLQLPASRLLSASSLLPDDIRELFVEPVGGFIRPAHELIAAEILEQVLSKDHGERRNWKLALADTAVEFVKLAATQHVHASGALSQLVRTVVIERGLEETAAGPWEGQFSRLIAEIPSPEGKRRVLEALTECFPDEPHFWAHLGRFHSRITHDHEEAHKAHEAAVALAPHDGVLHHMAGMAWRAELQDVLDREREGELLVQAERRIQLLCEEAGRSFAEARALDPRSEYNYVSQIQMLCRVIGIVARLKGFGTDTARLLSSPREQWYSERLDEAEGLYSELTLIRAGEAQSRFVRQTRVLLDDLYGDRSKVIEGWTNILAQGNVYRPPVRRALIRAYLSKHNHDWTQLTARELARVSKLAKENIDEEPDSDQNLRQWFRLLRITGEVSILRLAEELANRRLKNPTVDTLYYLYILRYLQADAGILAMAREAMEIMAECSRMSAQLPQRTRAFEWLGKQAGLPGLVHVTSLGKWDDNTDFYANAGLLRRVTGRIAKIESPGAGYIELPIGLSAFFVPSRGKVDGGYVRGQDVGRRVEFYLGFSYDGLRAMWVSDVGEGRGLAETRSQPLRGLQPG